jgi:hypothetical protein
MPPATKTNSSPLPSALLDAHRARLDARDQWRVARQDAELAALARQGDELGLAGVDALLGGNHVNVDGSGH